MGQGTGCKKRKKLKLYLIIDTIEIMITSMISREEAPEYLRLAGEALFGQRWQTDLARALGLSDAARLRQWLSLARPVPPGIWDDIAGLLVAQQKKIAGTIQIFEEKKQAAS